jgi:hypothetical protein
MCTHSGSGAANVEEMHATRRSVVVENNMPS